MFSDEFVGRISQPDIGDLLSHEHLTSRRERMPQAILRDLFIVEYVFEIAVDRARTEVRIQRFRKIGFVPRPFGWREILLVSDRFRGAFFYKWRGKRGLR